MSESIDRDKIITGFGAGLRAILPVVGAFKLACRIRGVGTPMLADAVDKLDDALRVAIDEIDRVYDH